MDIGAVKIDINCPVCRKKQSVSLNDVSKGKHVKCACGQTIALVDENHSTRKSVKGLNNAFSNMEKSFKKFGK